MRQEQAPRLEKLRRLRYHEGFRIQGKPVFLLDKSAIRATWHRLGAATLIAATLAAGQVAQARESTPRQDTVALSALPAEAQNTYRLIHVGGPFPYDKDGSVFGNRERLLPVKARGYYREYTVKTPRARNRGARRLVCGGKPPTTPDVCYYTDDHYASFKRVAE